ncbi:MAG: dephospho-CoA kinase, partial [Alphaproteobacteria bacterium]|nr:dephospho-CoA kinase [Alphaproteobacteria bacterium]
NDLAEIFPDCLNSNGVDTKKIAEKVFKNRTDLDKLESYIFPKFRKEIVKEIARIRMTKKYNYLILEAPTLFESKSENICDFIITVTAPRKICISRALARNHFTEDQVRFILKRQTSNAYKLAKSDYSLVSDFGESFVVRKLNKIIGDINARCKNMS